MIMDDTNETIACFPIVKSLLDVPIASNGCVMADMVVFDLDSTKQPAYKSNDTPQNVQQQRPKRWMVVACTNESCCNIVSYPLRHSTLAKDTRSSARPPPVPLFSQATIKFDSKVEAVALIVNHPPRSQVVLVAFTRDGKLWRSNPSMNLMDIHNNRQGWSASDCMVECQLVKPPNANPFSVLLGTKRLTRCIEQDDSRNETLLVATGTMLGPPQILVVSSHNDVESYEIPGLDHVTVPVTSALFLSSHLLPRSVWKALDKTFDSTTRIVLLGLANGSIWSCMVVKNNQQHFVTGTRRVGTLKRKEAIVSILCLPHTQDNARQVKNHLVDVFCVGSLGTVAVLTTRETGGIVLQNLTRGFPTSFAKWTCASPFCFGSVKEEQNNNISKDFSQTSYTTKSFDCGIVATREDGSTWLLALSRCESLQQQQHSIDSMVVKLPVREEMAMVSTMSSSLSLQDDMLLAFSTLSGSLLLMNIDQSCWDSLWWSFDHNLEDDSGRVSKGGVLRLLQQSYQQQQLEKAPHKRKSTKRAQELLRRLERLERHPPAATMYEEEITEMSKATDLVLEALSGRVKDTVGATGTSIAKRSFHVNFHPSGQKMQAICRRKDADGTTIPVFYGGTAISVSAGTSSHESPQEILNNFSRHGDSSSVSTFKSLSVRYPGGTDKSHGTLPCIDDVATCRTFNARDAATKVGLVVPVEDDKDATQHHSTKKRKHKP